jgi:hypothetical protein
MVGRGWDLICKAEAGGEGGLEAFDQGAAPGSFLVRNRAHTLTRSAA